MFEPVIAVLVAVAVMLLAADPLANFIRANPTIVMLALGFLLLIGTTLIAEGFGAHVPKGYIYAAMAFSALIEGFNMMARRARDGIARRRGEPPAADPKAPAALFRGITPRPLSFNRGRAHMACCTAA